MKPTAILFFLAALAASTFTDKRTIDFLELDIGIGVGDELRYLYINAVIHEREMQFLCLESEDITVVPFKRECPTRYISEHMDIEKDVGNITYAVVPPLPKMKSEAIFDKPLQLEFTYVSPDYDEMWTAHVEVEEDAIFYADTNEQLSLIMFTPGPFDYTKVVGERLFHPQLETRG